MSSMHEQGRKDEEGQDETRRPGWVQPSNPVGQGPVGPSAPDGPSGPGGPNGPTGTDAPRYDPNPYGNPQSNYGQVARSQAGKPDNYLVWAIISVFLFWPLSIPAVLFASQVDGKWAMGDVAGAHDSSRKARLFSLLSTAVFGVGILLTIAYFVFVFVVIGVTAGSSGY